MTFKCASCGNVALFALCFHAFPKHMLPSTLSLNVDAGHELEGLTCFTQRPVVVAHLRATFLKPRASSETQLERIREMLGPEDSAALLIQSHLPPSLYFQCYTDDITMWLEDSESQIFRRPQDTETLHGQVKPLYKATKIMVFPLCCCEIFRDCLSKILNLQAGRWQVKELLLLSQAVFSTQLLYSVKTHSFQRHSFLENKVTSEPSHTL